MTRAGAELDGVTAVEPPDAPVEQNAVTAPEANDRRRPPLTSDGASHGVRAATEVTTGEEITAPPEERR